MNINSKGTYTISEDHYEMSIDYSYYYTSGSYELPPAEDMEIESVDLNGMDITDFFWDFCLNTNHCFLLLYRNGVE